MIFKIHTKCLRIEMIYEKIDRFYYIYDRCTVQHRIVYKNRLSVKNDLKIII